MRTVLIVVALAILGCPSGDDGATGDGAGTAADSGSETGTPGSCPNGQAEMAGTNGASDPLMDSWGAPCMNNDDCVALLGADAICEDMAVVYELPGGYCTKPCVLPDTDTRVVMDDPACDPNGGVACIGRTPLFQRCAILCTDSAQCNRDGYFCRQMPMISEAGDPKACLMPDCCLDMCEGG